MRRFAALSILGLLVIPAFSEAASCLDLSRTLSRGSAGSEVTALQELLYDAYSNFPSPTGYFGPVTEAAVKQWQKEHGIVSYGTPTTTGYGSVGPKTRAAMRCSSRTTQPMLEIRSQSSAEALPTQPATFLPALVERQGTASPASQVVLFTRTLDVGSRGADVFALQQLLIARGLLPAGSATGYFGAQTRAAVAIFQRQNGLEQVGAAGPRTRALLNAQPRESALPQPPAPAVDAAAARNAGPSASCPVAPPPASSCSAGWKANTDSRGCVTSYVCSLPLQEIVASAEVVLPLPTQTISPQATSPAPIPAPIPPSDPPSPTPVPPPPATPSAQASSSDFGAWVRTAMNVAENHFDSDSGLTGQLNKPSRPACVSISQDFGWSDTAHAGSARGEIGGSIAKSNTSAFYGVPHSAALDFNAGMGFEGSIVNQKPGEAYVGFFNPSTLLWRPANFFGLRLDGERVEVTIGTGLYRATGPDFNLTPRIPADGKPHRFWLDYVPSHGGGRGGFRLKIDGDVWEGAVPDEFGSFKNEPLNANMFGIMNVQKSTFGAAEIYLDDIRLTTTDARYSFDASGEGGWSGTRSRATYDECVLRPYHDFGFSSTGYAGGGRGEIGGRIWRGAPLPELGGTSFYGLPLSGVSLEDPLYLKGRISFRYGMTDSGAVVGFFNRQKLFDDFFGIMIEGPTRDGHWFRAYARGSREQQGDGTIKILPDGRPHEFEFMYDPAKGQYGTVTIRLDGQTASLPLQGGIRSGSAGYDMLGILPAGPGDGNLVELYLDDLVYTSGKRTSASAFAPNLANALTALEGALQALLKLVQ